MSNRKFEFTGETKKTLWGVELHRIKAVSSFHNVRAGELGGWIEKESNLSVEGDAWVSEEARVWGNARVRGNAKVRGNAEVCGNAEVWGDAEVWGNARVYDGVNIYDGAVVHGDALVSGSAEVCGNARVYGNAHVRGDALVSGSAEVCGNAHVHGDALVSGSAEVYGDADITLVNHVLTIGPIGGRSGHTTFYRDKDSEIAVACGCFNGKIDKFLEKVAETHKKTKHAHTYRMAAELAKLQIDLTENGSKK